MFADQGTNAGILTREHHPQILRLVLRIVLRIGIQLPQHRIDARADHILRIQRVDIEQVEVLIYIIKYIKVLSHLEVMVFLSLRHTKGRQEH